MKNRSLFSCVSSAAVVLSLTLAAPATLLVGTDFDGSTGYHVFAGNTDNTSGSSALTVNWTTDASVTSISGLTAISTGDSGTLGGFAVTQNGAGTYANPGVVFLSRNHNTDTDRTTSRRGFSLTFTTDSAWNLDQLTVLSGHTNNSGNQDQAFGSDLIFALSGGSLGSPLTGISPEDYAVLPAYHSVAFDLTGNAIDAGTYTLDVYQSNMPGGGAYATYDGLTIDVSVIPEPATALLLGLGLLAVVRRRR